MYLGKTLFAQVMDFLPWKTFDRIVDRTAATPDAQPQLRRAVSCHGLRATDLPRELARYRSVPGGSGRQALPHGHRRGGRSLDAGRCQRIARLAHLRRVGPTADRRGPRALRRRELRRRAGQHRLCARMPRPSICACRCSRGRRFAPPRRLSSCTRCSICEATIPSLHPHLATARCTTSTCSTCCPWRLALST